MLVSQAKARNIFDRHFLAIGFLSGQFSDPSYAGAPKKTAQSVHLLPGRQVGQLLPPDFKKGGGGASVGTEFRQSLPAK